MKQLFLFCIILITCAIFLTSCSNDPEPNAEPEIPDHSNLEGTYEFESLPGGNSLKGIIKLEPYGAQYIVQSGTTFTINDIEYTNTKSDTIGLVKDTMLGIFRLEADEDNYIIFGYSDVMAGDPEVEGGNISSDNSQIGYSAWFSWAHCYAENDCMDAAATKIIVLYRK